MPKGKRDTKNIARNKKRMLEALDASNGNVTVACRNAGVSRNLHYKYMDAYPRYEEAVNKVLDFKGDVLNDLAEHGLLNALETEKPWAIKYTLDNLGKSRGYNTDNREDTNVEMKLIISKDTD